ncbi:MAG: hypothetical protein KC587_05975 [Nitrospira sp.]|nr:hypothetical protein [Nitrospira sp.]MCA9456189.1 hypothetical protein [Nitrospira sp.]MCW5783535.1 hypothetical protein [Nitrospirales bacterium]
MGSIPGVRSRFGRILQAIAGCWLTLAFVQATWAEKLEDVLTMDVVVHFIDVGVGDAILVETPDLYHEILIDGGDRRRGFNFLEYIGPDLDDPIELAIITHADYDHWSGLERLLASGLSIQELWDPGYNRDCKFTGRRAAQKKQKDQYLKFIQTLPREGMRLRRPVPVDPLNPLFNLDGVRLWVLHADPNPPNEECSYMVNDASVVIRMQYKDVVFLFTGDANGKERSQRGNSIPSHVEAKLLALEVQHPGFLRADVLKVPHHGSETANTTAFIKAVAPRVTVISSTSTAHYHLPASRVLRRYQRAHFDRVRNIEKVLRTDYDEGSYERRQFGDDHIICGTNGDPADLICDYIWNFEE